MRFFFSATLMFLFVAATSESSRADEYFAAKYLSSSDAVKKWGIEVFNAKTFKSSSEKAKGAMAVHALQKKLFVGQDMLNVRRDMGDPDSFFFSDTIYAYMITSGAKPNQETWELVFVPDKELKKVAEVKIHKKCCYEIPADIR